MKQRKYRSNQHSTISPFWNQGHAHYHQQTAIAWALRRSRKPRQRLLQGSHKQESLPWKEQREKVVNKWNCLQRTSRRSEPRLIRHISLSWSFLENLSLSTKSGSRERSWNGESKATISFKIEPLAKNCWESIIACVVSEIHIWKFQVLRRSKVEVLKFWQRNSRNWVYGLPVYRHDKSKY